jgi:hypothetical protein
MTWFTLSAPDNGLYMWGSAEQIVHPDPALRVCSSCGYKVDASAVRRSFRSKKPLPLLSFTYDGYLVVPVALVAALRRAGLTGLVVRDLEEGSGLAILQSSVSVPFDAKRRGTRFEGKCTDCGLYAAVSGATPAFLLSAPPADVASTDTLFGSGNERQPLLIFSRLAREVLLREAGPLDFEPVVVGSPAADGCG